MSDPEAAFQRALLELIAQGVSPRELRRRLASDPSLEPLRAYCEGLDLHALRVALELYSRWSGDP